MKGDGLSHLLRPSVLLQKMYKLKLRAIRLRPLPPISKHNPSGKLNLPRLISLPVIQE